MASKKYLFLIVLLCMTASGAFAQTISSYDMRDSSLIKSKNLPQHNEFMNNAYAFPAKPRNQWELGVKVGLMHIGGDVSSRFLNPGFGLHARKALGYVFSLRGDFNIGWPKGINTSSAADYRKNSAWYPAYNPTTQRVFYNYKTRVMDLSLQGVANLTNINFHRAKNKVNVYVFAGAGVVSYHAKVNALNGSTPYNFATAVAIPPTHDNRKDIRDELDNIMDDSYETDGEVDQSAGKLFDHPYSFILNGGIGIQFKLSPKMNLAFEEKLTATRTDLLDGQRWQENGPSETALTPSNDYYNFFSVGLNFNIGKKAVEPLWWINPLDYAYNEINQPKHMKLPKPVLDDADGDGITDQFDQEPNTPAGAPVDSHGVSRDTDGDGVPDFRDKELITPTQCQPVDADGVGKCPDPNCCNELRATIDSLRNGRFLGGCGIGDLPSITFTGRAVTLSRDAQALLASVAQKMRNNASCRVAVIGYGESSKAAQQLSWDRVNAVINYLVDKEGISADRFIWRSGQTGGDENTVDLRDATGEEGPNTVPAPHPNLRRRG